MKIKLFFCLLLIISLLLVSACQTNKAGDVITTEIIIETDAEASETIIEASEDLSNIADDLDELNGMLGE